MAAWAFSESLYFTYLFMERMILVFRPKRADIWGWKMRQMDAPRKEWGVVYPFEKAEILETMEAEEKAEIVATVDAAE